MSFGEKLAEYLKNNKMDQKELAELLGVKEQTISAYITKKNNPTYARFVQICTQLKINANYFIDGFDNEKESESKLNSEDKYIIDHYKSLTTHDKEIVDHIFNMEPEEPTKIYRFPIYEQQAAAGAGITGRDGKFTMENIFTDDISKNAVFGVHIKGTSMINIDSVFHVEDIPDNSFVLLNPKVSVSDLNKTIVVASINNEVICKYFLIEHDGIHFYSLNRREHADDDRFAKSPNDYKIIGQVVKVIKPDEHE